MPAQSEGVPWQTLGTLLELEERTIREYAQEGVFVRTGRGRYLLAPSVRNYVRKLREIAAGRPGDQLNADENARLKIVQRRNLELKNAVLEGSMVPDEAIAPNWARVMRAVRSAMLAVPGKARFRRPHLTPQDMNPIDPRNPGIVRCGAFFEDRAQRLSN